MSGASTQDFANRLRRNFARLRPWAEREGLGAFRVYDRDIPEHPWAVDWYEGRVVATEFLTPVARRQSAAQRAAEVAAARDAVARVLGVAPPAVVVKSRAPAGPAERVAHGSAEREFPVRERECRFLVNLEDYADTGLFLDHREARRRVAREAAGRSLLNLFCYTGAFSVCAARAGAHSSVSVDLSRTYLDWARRNFALNAVDESAHRLVRADAFEFLREAGDRFDVVVLDPPTLSRSAAGRSFDVQQAHPLLVNLALARLRPGGLLFFSTNYRRFRLDAGALRARDVRETTRRTLPPDFRSEVHRSWEIRADP